MSDDLVTYDAIMTEASYWHSLNDFLLVCQSQGYYSVILELIDLCPVYEKGMLLDALKAIVQQDSGK